MNSYGREDIVTGFTKQKASVKRSSVSSFREGGSVVSKLNGAKRAFSVGWVLASTLGYLALQVVLGIVVQNFVSPYIVAQHTKFFAEGLVIILGFYVGAFMIGVFSPGRRIIEPTLGAIAAIVAAFSVANFTPQMGGWLRYGGLSSAGTAIVLAALFAAFGSYSGEKLMGNTSKG